jgi:glycosyltransferase involved in cell wall biosynthesis
MKGIDAVLIVGGAVPYGTTFDQYQERIDKRHIRSYIHAQFVSDELTTIMFNAADILVLPYKYFFSQSGVLLEGIKYGVPIVSTDVGCFREYIDKYHIGCVCQPNNVSELNNAIQVVLNDKSIKEDRFAVARVENTHENSSKEYLKVFRELLNKQNDK